MPLSIGGKIRKILLKWWGPISHEIIAWLSFGNCWPKVIRTELNGGFSKVINSGSIISKLSNIDPGKAVAQEPMPNQARRLIWENLGITQERFSHSREKLENISGRSVWEKSIHVSGFFDWTFVALLGFWFFCCFYSFFRNLIKRFVFKALEDFLRQCN